MARDVNDPLGRIAVDPPTTTSSIVMPISSHDRPCVRWGKGKKRETLVTDPAPWEIAVEEDPGPSPFGVGRVYIAPSFSKLSSVVSCVLSCTYIYLFPILSYPFPFPSPLLLSLSCTVPIYLTTQNEDFDIIRCVGEEEGSHCQTVYGGRMATQTGH